MRSIHRRNRDLQREAPAGVCAQCGGELYPGDRCWQLWGGLLCETCVGPWLLGEMAPFCVRLGEVEQ